MSTNEEFSTPPSLYVSHLQAPGVSLSSKTYTTIQETLTTAFWSVMRDLGHSESSSDFPSKISYLDGQINAHTTVADLISKESSIRLSALRKERNKHARFNELPIEIIERIFAEALDLKTVGPPTTPSHLSRLKSIATVCASWYSFVLGCPSLWTVIEFGPKHRQLSKVISRSANRPLLIRCKNPVASVSRCSVNGSWHESNAFLPPHANTPYLLNLAYNWMDTTWLGSSGPALSSNAPSVDNYSINSTEPSDWWSSRRDSSQTDWNALLRTIHRWSSAYIEVSSKGLPQPSGILDLRMAWNLRELDLNITANTSSYRGPNALGFSGLPHLERLCLRGKARVPLGEGLPGTLRELRIMHVESTTSLRDIIHAAQTTPQLEVLVLENVRTLTGTFDLRSTVHLSNLKFLRITGLPPTHTEFLLRHLQAPAIAAMELNLNVDLQAAHDPLYCLDPWMPVLLGQLSQSNSLPTVHVRNATDSRRRAVFFEIRSQSSPDLGAGSPVHIAFEGLTSSTECANAIDWLGAHCLQFAPDSPLTLTLSGDFEESPKDVSQSFLNSAAIKRLRLDVAGGGLAITDYLSAPAPTKQGARWPLPHLEELHIVKGSLTSGQLLAMLRARESMVDGEGLKPRRLALLDVAGFSFDQYEPGTTEMDLSLFADRVSGYHRASSWFIDSTCSWDPAGSWAYDHSNLAAGW